MRCAATAKLLFDCSAHLVLSIGLLHSPSPFSKTHLQAAVHDRASFDAARSAEHKEQWAESASLAPASGGVQRAVQSERSTCLIGSLLHLQCSKHRKPQSSRRRWLVLLQQALDLPSAASSAPFSPCKASGKLPRSCGAARHHATCQALSATPPLNKAVSHQSCAQPRCIEAFFRAGTSCKARTQASLSQSVPCRARKQTEFEKRKAAFAKLIGLLMSMMKRRALYDVLPLDPTAWPVLLAAHREELRTTMAEQAALNRVDLSTMEPPGAQVGRYSAAMCLEAVQPLCHGQDIALQCGRGRKSQQEALIVLKVAHC